VILAATEENLERAGTAWRAGELVVIPTETVYGLAGDATNAQAARAIFAAKGRPADNPLIVHVADIESVEALVTEFPESARKLAKRFWPGPLTLVLPKSDQIPMEVSGGLDTVAVRMPDHPVALAVIRGSGRPLAAPSANQFMRLSPTRAEHVDPQLAEIILDGGPCRVGVESTVLDCSQQPFRILRAGGVPRVEIEGALGHPLSTLTNATTKRSPGMYPRHYAPRARLLLVETLEGDLPGISFTKSGPGQFRLPRDPRAYAANLYEALHQLDALGLPEVFVEIPPDEAAWEAIQDRLKRMTA